jgi:hypothetical protein
LLTGNGQHPAHILPRVLLRPSVNHWSILTWPRSGSEKKLQRASLSCNPSIAASGSASFLRYLRKLAMVIHTI